MENVKLRLLIVDDEVGMCMAAQRVLRDFSVKVENIDTEVSFDVSCINNAEDFARLFPGSDTSILIMDYKLKDDSGIELMRKYVTNNNDILTIMITAYATFETAVHATKMGAYDFLAKPFTPEELRYSVHKAANHLMYARHAKRLEEEKKKIRFEFISILAHELKAPIYAIEGYLDILEKRLSQLTNDDILNMIHRSRVRIDGMKKLIFDLLDMTRIESGQKKRVLSDLDIVKFMKNMVETYQIEAQPRNISINLETESDPILFKADADEMEIIANNLISNAIKYNRDGGSVSIKLSERDNKVCIEISDTGIGMNEEERSKIFNDFVRIKNEKTAYISGSGLGLSTVKKLAQLYGGSISVESIPDAGSKFMVELKK